VLHEQDRDGNRVCLLSHQEEESWNEGVSFHDCSLARSELNVDISIVAVVEIRL
jgi:hypothetical protein